MAAQKQHYYKSNTSERLSWFFYFIDFGINIRSVGFIRITLQKQENNSNYPTFKQNVLEKKRETFKPLFIMPCRVSSFLVDSLIFLDSWATRDAYCFPL
jgi:hypothetical protein